MIKFNFIIENPWSDRFDAGYCWGRKITKHKAWEFQAYRSNVIFEKGLYITTRQDHAGIKLEFGVLTFSFVLQIYDTRHWNYDKNCWEVYDANQA